MVAFVVSLAQVPTDQLPLCVNNDPSVYSAAEKFELNTVASSMDQSARAGVMDDAKFGDELLSGRLVMSARWWMDGVLLTEAMASVALEVLRWISIVRDSILLDHNAALAKVLGHADWWMRVFVCLIYGKWMCLR